MSDLIVALSNESPGTPNFLPFVGNGGMQALPSAPCTQVEVLNNTAQDIAVDRGAGSNSFNLPAGTSKVFHTLANANELRINAPVGVSLPIEVWG